MGSELPIIRGVWAEAGWPIRKPVKGMPGSGGAGHHVASSGLVSETYLPAISSLWKMWSNQS